ncbi:hypothetical protein ACFVAJ_16845 [Agromyces sp. NPDC057679]|uniref:hypothetical protein n=1 Tax=Agromyces sp. NPDC057679 TaxID=3346207 RepID=UPI00366B57C6
MKAHRPRPTLRSAVADRLTILRRRDGIEVSIPNIIVAISISVAVLLAAAVGAITVIPMANDATAQGTVSAVKTAQEIYIAKNRAGYATGAQLIAEKFVQKNGSNVAITQSGTGAAAIFCVGVLSDSGKTWWGVSGATNIVDTIPAAPAGCPTAAQVAAATDLS